MPLPTLKTSFIKFGNAINWWGQATAEGQCSANNNSGSLPSCDCDFGNDRWHQSINLYNTGVSGGGGRSRWMFDTVAWHWRVGVNRQVVCCGAVEQCRMFIISWVIVGRRFVIRRNVCYRIWHILQLFIYCLQRFYTVGRASGRASSL